MVEPSKKTYTTISKNGKPVHRYVNQQIARDFAKKSYYNNPENSKKANRIQSLTKVLKAGGNPRTQTLATNNITEEILDRIMDKIIFNDPQNKEIHQMRRALLSERLKRIREGTVVLLGAHCKREHTLQNDMR